MMESLYGNGLVVLGLWVSMSLVMLLIWGLLAWAVVNILSRRRFRGHGRAPPANEILTLPPGRRR